MEVKQSEFARMCGVSAMAISLQIRKGNLIKNENGKISTEEKSNKNYLSKHLKKAYIQKQESLATNEGEFDIFEGLNRKQTSVAADMIKKDRGHKKGILLFSSMASKVYPVSDRVFILRHGRLTRDLSV